MTRDEMIKKLDEDNKNAVDEAKKPETGKKPQNAIIAQHKE